MRQRHINVAMVSCLIASLACLSCSSETAPELVEDTSRTHAFTGGESRPPQLDPSDEAPLNIDLELDTERTVRQVLSTEGGTLQMAAEDGSKFILTIPRNALADRVEIALTPVSSALGLPAGVSLVAAVQLSPEGLLLLEPAVLTIQAARPAPAEQEVTFSWTGDGEFVHAYPVSPRTEIPEFHLTHFSGAGLAAGSDSAVQPIMKAPAAPCSDMVYSRVAQLTRQERVAIRSGKGGRGEEIVAEYAAASRRYLDEVLIPLVSEAARDDSLFHCVMRDYLAWYRSGHLFMSSAFESQFGDEARAVGDSLWSAPLSNFFEGCYGRCMKGESPLFQAVNMGGVIRHLQLISREDLMPPSAVERFLDCSREISFLVDIDTQLSNAYNMQGQGIDVASSVTRLTAQGIVAKYDKERSNGETRAVFTGGSKAATATVSVEWRNRCPNQARVEPGASLEVVVTPILNPRVGRLQCKGGKPKCESTDLNPGSMVELFANVVESTYLYTETGGQCQPVNYWNEFMMFFMGSQSVGSDAPFQVPGTSGTIVRRGTSVRRVPIDLPPELRALNPDMKDYVEISTPAINSAIEQTRITIKTQQR